MYINRYLSYMKIRKTPIAALTLLSISALLIYSSCNKDSPCDPIPAQLPNRYILLEIKNSMNQNLLDPATTGHYDTAMIKKINGDKILITRPGFLPVRLVFDYISNPGVKIFSLTTTHQDTLNISTRVVVQKCYTYYNLQWVKYNNVTLKPDSANVYTAHK